MVKKSVSKLFSVIISMFVLVQAPASAAKMVDDIVMNPPDVYSDASLGNKTNAINKLNELVRPPLNIANQGAAASLLQKTKLLSNAEKNAWIDQNKDNLITLFIMVRSLFVDDPDESYQWYMAGQLALMTDVFRCANPGAAEAIPTITSRLMPETAFYKQINTGFAFLNPDKAKAKMGAYDDKNFESAYKKYHKYYDPKAKPAWLCARNIRISVKVPPNSPQAKAMKEGRTYLSDDEWLAAVKILIMGSEQRINELKRQSAPVKPR